ncbi:MAG: nucleotidyltransferase domain-containing protein [Gammaproteobacteria bacterium]|nr:nucleotidyltransferase domain-containing protein [Gammaproteobacteria bacterium]
MDALTTTLAQDPRIAYALMFGSRARGEASNTSDLDVAIGLEPGIRLSAQELGELIADLERDSGQVIDLVLLDDSPPALAYRIFADGHLLAKRNHDAFVARKVRAILEYLDFASFEARCAQGVLKAAANG